MNKPSDNAATIWKQRYDSAAGERDAMREQMALRIAELEALVVQREAERAAMQAQLCALLNRGKP